jgi:aminopeptidase N
MFALRYLIPHGGAPGRALCDNGGCDRKIPPAGKPAVRRAWRGISFPIQGLQLSLTVFTGKSAPKPQSFLRQYPDSIETTTMSTETPSTPPNTTFLKDYRPPDWRIEAAELRFDLGESSTEVQAKLILAATGHPVALRLDGQELALRSVRIDGRSLARDEYHVDEDGLTLTGLPARCVLETVVQINPRANTALEGLYLSGGNLCTQCEAEGFRKITYFLDRPDNLTIFTVTLVADKARYPVLLSNGNLVDGGELEDGRHWARWHDPFPKPSYLFAVVAGDLACIADEFVTASRRWVQLLLYVQHHNVDKCDHAMQSLKRAMKWDEEVYGREYDLDTYMIVAVDDFNMGAMENKGLNVFNSKCVLARPDTATDQDYLGIEGVIAHEYFHNWSGNRVTCRDWFQLSLKEGFTVFRDQCFSADMGARSVKRISDVNVLRTYQFREDAGPMAHPVRPEAYVEINNFYTGTVYNKGAEVVRMLHTLLGADGFRRGTDLYFTRHDGQAVTTDDFVSAMEDANEIDLKLFRRWYSQAGTPELRVAGRHDPVRRTFTLNLRQSCPPTPGQPEKLPLHIPVAVGLLGSDGCELPLRLSGEDSAGDTTRILELRETEQQFVFHDVADAPVVSLLRGFSAPVKLMRAHTDAEQCFLMQHDGDDFNRWEAAQQLAVRRIQDLIDAGRDGRALVLDNNFSDACAAMLDDDRADPAFIAQALTLPSETYLAECVAVIDPGAIHLATKFMRRELARRLRTRWEARYEQCAARGPYNTDPAAMGWRALRNLALRYLMALEDPAVYEVCLRQYRLADNMTDVIAALGALVDSAAPARDAALEDFYGRWHEDALVVDKWLSIQATSQQPGTINVVDRLLGHPAFNLRNPNKVRALIGGFCQGNPACFHELSGAGYAFLGDRLLELDAINPQIAARLAGALSAWRRYDAIRRDLMRAQLDRLAGAPGLSRDLYEVVNKSVAG